MATDKVNRVIYSKVHQRLGKVMHGFIGLAYGDKDLSGAVAEGFAHGFVFGLVLNELAVVDEAELAEEVAAFFGGFFEER